MGPNSLGMSAYCSSHPMIDEYGEFGGMRIGRGNRSTRRKPALVRLFFHKPHLTWHWTLAALMGSRRLTAWAMARPFVIYLMILSVWVCSVKWLDDNELVRMWRKRSQPNWRHYFGFCFEYWRRLRKISELLVSMSRFEYKQIRNVTAWTNVFGCKERFRRVSVRSLSSCVIDLFAYRKVNAER
jgi:hypothetical protein